jgi:hypothetical protein
MRACRTARRANDEAREASLAPAQTRAEERDDDKWRQQTATSDFHNINTECSSQVPQALQERKITTGQVIQTRFLQSGIALARLVVLQLQRRGTGPSGSDASHVINTCSARAAQAQFARLRSS